MFPAGNSQGMWDSEEPELTPRVGEKRAAEEGNSREGRKGVSFVDSSTGFGGNSESWGQRECRWRFWPEERLGGTWWSEAPRPWARLLDPVTAWLGQGTWCISGTRFPSHPVSGTPSLAFCRAAKPLGTQLRLSAWGEASSRLQASLWGGGQSWGPSGVWEMTELAFVQPVLKRSGIGQHRAAKTAGSLAVRSPFAVAGAGVSIYDSPLMPLPSTPTSGLDKGLGFSRWLS